jgi:Transposase domain (DUF772)
VFALEKLLISLKSVYLGIMMSPSEQGEATPDPGFYEKLRQHLAEIAFDQRVFESCERLYWNIYSDTNARVDFAVYFKMLMIGFLENLSSEQAIAARCSDSLSVRAFLGRGSKENIPGEDELCAVRHRLEPSVYEKVLDILVLAFKSYGLLDGETISPEIIEENANLRGLINRNTEFVCRSYFNELTRQPHFPPPKIQAAERDVASGSYKSEFAAPTGGTFHEFSDDDHQARWCRRIAGRRRVH